MIVLATLKDEQVAGKRRAAGKTIRKIVVIALDNYNILIAEGSKPSTLMGKKFFGRLDHLSNFLDESDLDNQDARHKILEFFKNYTGESVGDLSWDEISQKFHVMKRCNDTSGKLQLYVDMKESGWAESDDEPASQPRESTVRDTPTLHEV